jgi:hypothetical protein
LDGIRFIPVLYSSIYFSVIVSLSSKLLKPVEKKKTQHKRPPDKNQKPELHFSSLAECQRICRVFYMGVKDYPVDRTFIKLIEGGLVVCCCPPQGRCPTAGKRLLSDFGSDILPET